MLCTWLRIGHFVKRRFLPTKRRFLPTKRRFLVLHIFEHFVELLLE